jgi:uncharacterized protein
MNRIDEIVVKVRESETVSARLYSAPKNNRQAVTIILGHGAGANQLSGFMRMVAGGLAARGFDVITFNFLYTERGRRLPDPKPKLESCYLAVIEAALKHTKLKGNRLVIGGKSMGGRIASQVAAALSNPRSDISKQASRSIEIDGLVFLGYPLHPPGRPEKLRAEHLKGIRAPMLFVQGARDAFGAPDEIRTVMKQQRFKGEIFPIESGDHSFKVPKSSSVPQQQVYELAMDEIANWLAR